MTEAVTQPVVPFDVLKLRAGLEIEWRRRYDQHADLAGMFVGRAVQILDSELADTLDRADVLLRAADIHAQLAHGASTATPLYGASP